MPCLPRPSHPPSPCVFGAIVWPRREDLCPSQGVECYTRGVSEAYLRLLPGKGDRCSIVIVTISIIFQRSSECASLSPRGTRREGGFAHSLCAANRNWRARVMCAHGSCVGMSQIHDLAGHGVSRSRLTVTFTPHITTPLCPCPLISPHRLQHRPAPATY